LICVTFAVTMSAIFGIVGKREQRVDDTFKQVAREMVQWKPDNAGIYVQPGTCRYVHTSPASVPEALASKGENPDTIIEQLWAGLPYTYSVAMGSGLLWNTPESLSEFLPLYDKEAGLCLTADARIDNREALAVHFGYNWADIAQQPDSWYILQAYKKWGHDCPNHLLGDFAFAIWNEKEQELFAARDIMGVKPFFYSNNDEITIFSTNIKGVLCGVEKTERQQWFDDIKNRRVPKQTDTQYEGVFRLAPSHSFVARKDSFRTWRYFDFDLTKELHFETEEEYFEEFQRLLSQSVKARTRSIYPVGAEFSGGVDSTLVSFEARKQLQQEGKFLYTFAHALPVGSELESKTKLSDRARIEMVCKAMDMPEPEYFTGEGRGLLDDLKRSLNFTGEIPPSRFALYSDGIYEMAEKHNIRCMLSGFGGDQAVSYAGRGCANELIRKRQLKRYVSYCFAQSKGKKLGFVKLILLNGLRFIKNGITIRADQRRMLFDWYTQYRVADQNLIAAQSRISYSYPLLDGKLLFYALVLPTSFYTNKNRYVPLFILGKNRFPLIQLKSGLYAASLNDRIKKDSTYLIEKYKIAEDCNISDFFVENKIRILTDLNL
jgi:asparagine synthetase B (glutamine-hydrolysing)